METTKVRNGGRVLHKENDFVETWLQSLYSQYSSQLYRYSLVLTSSVEDAQDTVQEVFSCVSREWRRLMEVDNIRAYLYIATRNASYSILRKRKRSKALHETICVDLANACVPMEKQTSATIISIRSALSELTLEQREVIVLKILNQMTFKEIADTMKVSLNTVAGRYRYGIEKIRIALGVKDIIQ